MFYTQALMSCKRFIQDDLYLKWFVPSSILATSRIMYLFSPHPECSTFRPHISHDKYAHLSINHKLLWTVQSNPET